MSGKGATRDDHRIGNLVRMMRLKAKMSQTELGASLGVSFQQVQKYEKGANRISGGSLVKLAAALGVEPQYFFANSGHTKQKLSDDVLELLSEKQNLRALTAFASIRRSRVRAAYLGMLEATAGT